MRTPALPVCFASQSRVKRLIVLLTATFIHKDGCPDNRPSRKPVESSNLGRERLLLPSGKLSTSLAQDKKAAWKALFLPTPSPGGVCL